MDGKALTGFRWRVASTSRLCSRAPFGAPARLPRAGEGGHEQGPCGFDDTTAQRVDLTMKPFGVVKSLVRSDVAPA